MMGFDLAAAAFFAADKLGGTKRVAPPAGAGVLAGGPQPEPEDVVEEEVAGEGRPAYYYLTHSYY